MGLTPPGDSMSGTPVDPAAIPEDVQMTFDLVGVMPIFLERLNREAWLSKSVTSEGKTLLIIDAGISPERLEVIADELLSAVAERLCESV